MIRQTDEIEKRVADRINPSPKDRKIIETTIKNVREKLQQEITKRDLPAAIELVGSTAKDTYLKHNMDIDLFLLFPTSVPKENIGQYAIAIGREILKDAEEGYAEHPYTRGHFNNYKVEIVPCYHIEHASQKLSAVDRTPLHTKYVKKHLQESQKQEVRLFKQFLHGIGCYGAEAEIEGFSGYLCEILIIKYGDFRKLIEEVHHWKDEEKLALSDGTYPSFDTPLSFIDPVDSNRNVASALSREKFDLFIRACKAYVNKPQMTFFFPNEVKPWAVEKIQADLEKQDHLYVGIIIAKPDIIDENLYPQIRKAARSIRELCERYDFTIHDATFHINEGKKRISIIIKTKKGPISKTFIHMGPPVKLKDNTKEFLQKWEKNPRVVRKPYKDNGRLYVEIEREYTDITDLLKDQVKKLSMGKHLEKIIKKNYEIVGLENLLKDDLQVFWTSYLDEKMSWER